jgi:2-polyprenyl-3-methyl-5-hydroxy-6-metoxy-1,4-benzoquinol methylase
MSILGNVLSIPKRALQLLSGGILRLDRIAEDSRRTRDELKALRREMHDRLLQYNFQLGRLSRAVDATQGDETRLSGRTIPIEQTAATPTWDAIGDGAPLPDPEGVQWQQLDACPACSHPERTVVCPWNKFILNEKAPDPSSVLYDYALCHACGVLYASRRPIADRYRFLLEHFGEVTAKRGGAREIPNHVLNPYPLSDDDRAALDRLSERGVFVSDHLGLPAKQYLGSMLKDRFENSVHIDVIGTLVNPRGGRVLEVRSRAGTILDGLRHAYGAEVYAMPIWESQQYLLRKIYGVQTSDLIDFENFTIPFDGPFDVIVCNHMFTHVLRPRDFFAELRRKLKPGGYIYLHNEPADAEFLAGNQMMLATLNPLHVQAFDQRSLVRALAANGFAPVFVKERNLSHMCLARQADTRMEPMDKRERKARIDAYQRAFDRAVLAMPPNLQPRVAGVWESVVQRAVAAGTVEFDEAGSLRLVSR